MKITEFATFQVDSISKINGGSFSGGSTTYIYSKSPEGQSDDDLDTDTCPTT